MVNIMMKVLCFLAVLGFAFADPKVYFQEAFECKYILHIFMAIRIVLVHYFCCLESAHQPHDGPNHADVGHVDVAHVGVSQSF